jgi:hypothetical protein
VELGVVRVVARSGRGANTASGGGLALVVATTPYVELGLGVVGGPTPTRILGVYRRSGQQGPTMVGGAVRRRGHDLSHRWPQSQVASGMVGGARGVGDGHIRIGEEIG